MHHLGESEIMKKYVLMAMLVLSISCMVGCGSKKQDTTEEQAEQRTSQLQEEVDHMEEDYKKYVENMGIDVDAALEEAGR